jgi:hypothetical protein
LGPLGPSSKQKRFLAVDLCETYKNESKSGTFGDRGFYFISQFCNIEKLAEFTPKKKKRSQIYTRKNIQFFWVKKKKFNRKNKTKHCFESPIVEDYIGFFLKMHCFCRFVLTNCSRPTENNACDHLHIFHIMIGLKLWNYWCALLLTYMGCMEMKMGSLEIEIVSNFVVLGELKYTTYVFRSFDQNPCAY